MSKKTSIELINENKCLEELFEAIIPEGDYCYEGLGIEIGDDKIPHRKIKCCPFWERNDSKDDQECGYCHLLKTGDWEEDGTFLLWDQVKECGLNKWDEEDDDFENKK